MRILIPVLGFGHFGGFRVLSKIADELIKLGHCVKFLSPDTSKEPYFPTSAAILWVDKNGNVGNFKNTLNRKKATAFSNQKQLTKAFLKLDPSSYDIIIANHSLTTIPIKIAGLAHKTLYYVQGYESDFYKMNKGFKNKILGILSASSYKMNLFTVVNADVYLKFKKLKASRVLYPGVDFSNFFPQNIPKKKEGEIIIGTIGRLERQKGTQYVLKAFIELKKKFPGIRLHIAFGNADDFSEHDDVYCFHPHGDKALGEYYRGLDFYFCGAFSQLGAFHYPVVEAMSCGVSVLTTEYYPANNNNAWIVRPKNIEDLIRGFEIAYKNVELRKKKIQQALIDVQQFDWQLVGQKLNVYIKELSDTDFKMK